MRTTIALCVCAVVSVAASSALGVADPEPNKVGIYFDLDANWSCAEPAFGAVAVYVVLTKPTVSEVHGWEAAVRPTQGELTLLASTFEGVGTDYGSEFEFSVRLTDPLPTSEATLLGTLQVLYLEHLECFILTGVSGSTVSAEYPVVWFEEGVPTIMAATQAYDSGATAALGNCGSVIGAPTFCDSVVPADEVSWSAVRATYR